MPPKKRYLLTGKKRKPPQRAIELPENDSSDEESSESSESEDESLDEKEREEKRAQRRAADRLRKQISRANFPNDALERRRELGRLRCRAKRANMTPAERRKQRERDTIMARERRAKLRKQGGEDYRLHLQQQAEKARIRRRLRAQQLYPAENAPDPNSVVPGETVAERQRRLQKEHRAKIRGQRDPVPVSILAREKAHDRIVDRIDRLLNKKEEIAMRTELGPWRKRIRYGITTPMEPEEEDNWAWKDLLYYKMQIEFQKERNILRNEALIIELGDDVPDQVSPLQDADWVTKLGNNIVPFQRRRLDSSATAQDLHQGAKEAGGNQSENENEDDEATAAVLSAFNQVEIKIEAEDYDDWDGNGYGYNSMETIGGTAEEDVSDWIARVITGEQEQSQDTATAGGSSSSSTRVKHSRHAKTQAVQKFQDIIRASRARGIYGYAMVEPDNTLIRHFKALAVKRAQDDKMHDLRNTFFKARQRWNREKPEDTERRAAVDQQRSFLKESLRIKKRAGVDTAVKELIHKRDFFSQETPEVRAERIAEIYATVSADLTQFREMRERLGKMSQEEIKERRKQKLKVTTSLTKEEIRKINTAKAMLRVKMEKLEYEQHIDLLMATGLPYPDPKWKCLEIPRRKQILEDVAKSGESLCSVVRFENALKHQPYVNCVIYFNGIKPSRTPSEVISYRRLLVELITRRRKRIDSSINQNQDIAVTSSDQQLPAPVEEYEWTGVPEAASLQDYQRFKDFITKYGEPVTGHLTHKRFYQNTYGKTHNDSFRTSAEKRNARRIKQNALLRKYYIKKKYGIELKPGEYFDKKTMSSVKKPPRTYLAYQKKAEERARLGLAPGQDPPSEDSVPELPEYSVLPDDREKSPRKRNRKPKDPNAIPRKRGPGNNPKKSKPSTSIDHIHQSVASSVATFNQPMAYIGHTSTGRNYTTTARNDVDYSNSGDGDVHHHDRDDDSDEGWVPLGSYEIDSVIRHDILNIPVGAHQQQHQNLQFSQSQQQQQLSSSHLYNTRSSTSSQQQHSSYQQFANQQHHSMPSLTLVDQFTANNYNNAIGQWNPNSEQVLSSTQPLNYSLQFLPNSQISLIQNQQLSSHLALASNAQQGYAWGQPSTSTNQNQYSRNYNFPPNTPLHHQQPQFEYDVVTSTPTSSIAAEDSHSLAGSEDASSSYSFSRPKSRGGRPKGSKNRPQSSLHKLKTTNIIRKRTFPPGAPRRDIWNNRQRRKFYTQSGIAPTPPIPTNEPVKRPSTLVESPFERNPQECRDAVLQEHISLLLPKCPHCDIVVDDDNILKRHIAAVHEQPRAVIAEPVIKPTNNRAWSDTKGKHPCSICSSELGSPGSLIKHLFLCHFVVGQFKCPFASKTPRTTHRWREVRCASFRFGRDGLRDHIQAKHPEEGKTCWVMGINLPKMITEKSKFCCLHCPNDYQSYSELKEHYKDTHDKARYCCVHCGIYLGVEDFWLDHVKLFHPEKPLRPVPPPVNVDAEDVFRCVDCDSEFSAQTFLDEHMAGGHVLLPGSSNRAKSFPCQACDKQFRSEDMRDDHFKNCKRRNTECYWCKSKFASRDVLDKHITDAHPQEPPVPTNQNNFSYSHEPYKCEICKRSYMSLYTLRLHCFYNHELYKYLQSIKGKYPTLSEEAAQLAAAAAAEKQKMNPSKEISPGTAAKDVKTPPASVTVPIPWTSKEEPHQEIDPNAKLITCPVCNTPGHNVHQTHKAYDKLMRRYCFTCERLFSRSNVLRQHNEAAHGQAPDAILTHPPPAGRPGKICNLALDNPEDYLECVCQRVFTKEEFHHHHLFFEKDPDIRVCGICSRKFFNHQAYLRHVHEDHGVPKNMKMAVYKKPQVAPLQTPQPKRQLREEDYDKLTSTTTMSTSGGEITIFSCKVCLKNFKTQAFLRTHIEEIHKEDAFTRVLCNKCNTTFATRQNLLKHQKYHHKTDIVKYLCPVCNVPIKRIDHLKVHHLNFHPDQVYNKLAVKTVPIEEANEAMHQISCKICSTSFATETGLKSHMTSRHFPTHFNTFCEHCGLQMNPKSMRAHISKDHPGVKNVEPSDRGKKTRLSLPEIIDMVQTLVDKCGVINPEIRERKANRKKPKSSTKAKASRKSARTKKRRMDLSSKSEDSNGDDAQDEDDFALHYVSSDSDEDAEIDFNASNAYDEVEPSGDEDEEEPITKRKITSKKKEPHSATKTKPLQKATTTKTKSRTTARTTITKKKGKKNLYCDDSEDEDVEKYTSRPRRGLRNDPSRSDHYMQLDDTKKLIVPLERCDTQPPSHSSKNTNSPPPNYYRKPRPKSKQMIHHKDDLPLIKVETQLEEFDMDFVIKDEPMDVEEDMSSVIQHNLDSLQQWDYGQLPMGEGEEEQDLP